MTSALHLLWIVPLSTAFGLLWGCLLGWNEEHTQEALQTVYDSLNHGQQKQIIKNEKVKALFDLYGVEYEE